MPKMNNRVKLVFALEHVAHLEDLIEGNEWEQYLAQNLSTMKYEFERQPNKVQNQEPMNIVNEQDLNNFETEKTTYQTFERPEETSHPTLVQEEMDKANEEAEAKKEEE